MNADWLRKGPQGDPATAASMSPTGTPSSCCSFIPNQKSCAEKPPRLLKPAPSRFVFPWGLILNLHPGIVRIRYRDAADVLNTDRHALFRHDFIEAFYRIQRARVTNPRQQLGNEAEQHISVITDIEIALNMPFHLEFDAAQGD